MRRWYVRSCQPTAHVWMHQFFIMKNRFCFRQILKTGFGGHVRTFLQFAGLFSLLLSPGPAPAAELPIAGGTGRFLHATGRFVLIAQGQLDVADGVTNGCTETFDGTINDGPNL